MNPQYVCLVFDSKGTKIENTGYTLNKKENEISGIMAWPCIFTCPKLVMIKTLSYHYKNIENMEKLIYRHWPNLLSIIMDKQQPLSTKIEPKAVFDKKSTYFVCQVDERVYFCVIFGTAV